MTAMRMAAIAVWRRWLPGCTKSVIDAQVLTRVVAASMVTALCVAGVARAAPLDHAPPEIEGRWVAAKRNLVLDITRCGEGWCGVEVTNGKSCGAVVLRFELKRPENSRDSLLEPALFGRLELAAETRPYAVQVLFYESTARDPVRLFINGNTGSTFDAWRRSFPFQAVFARLGDPLCTAAPKVS
jgi:hypothetical protein